VEGGVAVVVREVKAGHDENGSASLAQLMCERDFDC
jgi:hypothetical protein